MVRPSVNASVAPAPEPPSPQKRTRPTRRGKRRKATVQVNQPPKPTKTNKVVKPKQPAPPPRTRKKKRRKEPPVQAAPPKRRKASRPPKKSVAKAPRVKVRPAKPPKKRARKGKGVAPSHQWIQRVKTLRRTMPELYNIAAFKNRHKGKRCFVLGNAPSLAKLNLRLLANEITFGCNMIFTMRPRPALTYYSVIELKAFRRLGQQIHTYRGPIKFFPAFTRGRDWKYIRYITPANNMRFFPAENHWEAEKRRESPVSLDASKIVYCSYTVVCVLLQLAYYMGCNPIYVIGVDLTGGSHCTEDYYLGQGKYFKNLRGDALWNKSVPFFSEAKRRFSQRGIKVYNATPGGNLRVFPRVDYRGLFR